jgi:hypothetical protein
MTISQEAGHKSENNILSCAMHNRIGAGRISHCRCHVLEIARAWTVGILVRANLANTDSPMFMCLQIVKHTAHRPTCSQVCSTCAVLRSCIVPCRLGIATGMYPPTLEHAIILVPCRTPCDLHGIRLHTFGSNDWRPRRGGQSSKSLGNLKWNAARFWVFAIPYDPDVIETICLQSNFI